MKRIIDLAKHIGEEGFDNMEEEGAEELLKSNGEELSTEEFATQTSHKDDNEEYDEEPEKAELTTKLLGELFIATKTAQ